MCSICLFSVWASCTGQSVNSTVWALKLQISARRPTKMYSVNSMYSVRTNNITQFLPKETSLGYILHIDILVIQLQLKKLNVTVICVWFLFLSLSTEYLSLLCCYKLSKFLCLSWRYDSHFKSLSWKGLFSPLGIAVSVDQSLQHFGPDLKSPPDMFYLFSWFHSLKLNVKFWRSKFNHSLLQWKMTSHFTRPVNFMFPCHTL